MKLLCRKGFQSRNFEHMFKAIGILIVLWGLSHFFATAFLALNDAATEVFHTLEMAAVASQEQLQKKI